MLFSAWAKSEPSPGLAWSVLGSLNPRHCCRGHLVVEFLEAFLFTWGYAAVGHALLPAFLRGVVDGGAVPVEAACYLGDGKPEVLFVVRSSAV